ncbi:heat shock protein HslJ [Enterobacter pasteurii]|uniref:Heat shock protein HslJ n=1 Tax=Enterobacter cloacae TaxID=550 RepID=A0A7H8UHJ4_ENTCL|nr:MULTISPECIES: heat shock protein HslJ [Enterobacter cloacae complex]MCY0774863.1 heat shock protein HslJ [Enterobacter cloacae complex sp. 2022EL-00788]MDE4079677.1 heat shock protein HslJ [Enterobacter pasteurii]QKZ99019.1 heat shock protein HslJ [Enterobacter cloacae]QLA66335.1 heat shock protein HslJ [Enterobacter pasteurii]HAS1784251.1 heat shock protein HslJ [Enterobacter pasteurii]
MKKLAAISLLSLALAGCVNPGKASVQADRLENHRFVLENVDGKAVNVGKMQPEIRFSAQPNISLINNIVVSGTMCNGFNGQGKLSEGELKVKTLAMTRKLCTEPQLNELDQTLADMLRKGAQVDLTEDQLTLATADKSLMFKRVE